MIVVGDNTPTIRVCRNCHTCRRVMILLEGTFDSEMQLQRIVYLNTVVIYVPPICIRIVKEVLIVGSDQQSCAIGVRALDCTIGVRQLANL